MRSMPFSASILPPLASSTVSPRFSDTLSTRIISAPSSITTRALCGFKRMSGMRGATSASGGAGEMVCCVDGSKWRAVLRMSDGFARSHVRRASCAAGEAWLILMAGSTS